MSGAALHAGRVLLHTVDGLEYWGLPGGRVEFGETADQALLREMQEELGTAVRVRDLLWVVEQFFTVGPGEPVHAGREVHELNLIFRMELPEPQQDPATVLDGGLTLIFQWFPLSQLPPVRPTFLVSSLLKLPDSPEYVVIDERP